MGLTRLAALCAETWGGAVAANVTALEYDDATGALYIGTIDVLNVRYLNTTIERVDGFKGLPAANITSLAVQRSSVTGATVLHIGTVAGAASADITPAASTGSVCANCDRFGQVVLGGAPVMMAAAPLPSNQWAWSYKYLQRWLPGALVVDMAAHVTGSPFVLVATADGNSSVNTPLSGCGFALLEDQLWTLEAKSERMTAIQARHDRYGMVADCSLPKFGDPRCVQPNPCCACVCVTPFSPEV